MLQHYLPGGFAGFDKEGSPVLIELFGSLDVKGLLYSSRKVDIEKTKLLLGERVMKLLDDQSEKVTLVQYCIFTMNLGNLYISVL